MNRRRKRETQGRNTGDKTHTQQRDKGPAWVQLCINPNPEVERGWRWAHEQKAVFLRRSAARMCEGPRSIARRDMRTRRAHRRGWGRRACAGVRHAWVALRICGAENSL